MRQVGAERSEAERGFEAVGWLLTAVLLAAAFWLPEASAWPVRARLVAVAAVFGGANLLAHRLMAASSRGTFAYREDDRALVISVGAVMLITLYIYSVPGAPTALAYLYFLPIVGAVMVLQARVVLAETLLSLVAMLFLRAATGEAGPFWAPELVIRLVVFASVAACMAAVTARLRATEAEADIRTVDLSRRIERIQAVEALARQVELTSDIDKLAARAGGIIAGAVGAHRHAIFVIDQDRGGVLEAVGDADAGALRDRAALSTGENASVLRGVLETGVARSVARSSSSDRDGGAGVCGMLVVRLRASHDPMGVICLLDRRETGDFSRDEIVLCETLSSIAAPLFSGALLMRRAAEERRTLDRVAKTMIGREARVRELKSRLVENDAL